MSEDLVLQRSAEEIEALIQEVENAQSMGRGSRYPDLSYEDGIMETLRWLFEGSDHPYEGARWVAKR